MAESNSSEQPPSKKPKLASSINDLADEDLLNVFKRLPPSERLFVSEVCKRWHKITRVPWRDVVSIDLSSVRSASVGSIIQHCPNLQTVFARGYCMRCLKDLHVLSRSSLSSVKLYACTAELEEAHDGLDFELFCSLFSQGLRDAEWDELVLHRLSLHVNVEACDSCYGCAVAGSLPVSLKRLQLTGGLKMRFQGDRGTWIPSGRGVLDGLLRLEHLTCLILCSVPIDCLTQWDMGNIFPELAALSNLVELCTWCSGGGGENEFTQIVDLSFELPKLEVLFVSDVTHIDAEEDLTRLATKHPTLRIVVLTGDINDEWTVPARRLYPNGFGSDPLPLLRIFLDQPAAEMIIFVKSASDAIQVYPITAPLPEFLEKAEIAPIFDGVWIASQIKEGAKHGTIWFESEGDDTNSIRTVDDECSVE